MRLPLEAGFSCARIARREEWARLLVALDPEAGNAGLPRAARNR
jgi:hypothetical protein